MTIEMTTESCINTIIKLPIIGSLYSMKISHRMLTTKVVI